MSATLLAILSSFGWAAFDVARKYGVQRTSVSIAMLGFMSASLPVLTLLLIRKPELCAGWQSYFWLGAAGAVVNVISNVSFVKALSTSELGAAVPLLSLTPAMSLLWSAAFLGEEINVQKIGGVVLVVIGAVVLVGVKQLKTPSAGVGWMFLAALGWSAMGIFDKLSLAVISIEFHCFFQTLGILLFSIYMVGLRQSPSAYRVLFKNPAPFLLGTAAALAAVISSLTALSMMSVGVFETIKRGIGMFLSQVTGALLFGESFTARKILAVVLMLFGVAIVSL